MPMEIPRQKRNCPLGAPDKRAHKVGPETESIKNTT